MENFTKQIDLYKGILFIFLIILKIQVFSQETDPNILGEIRVGDKMPDLSLGEEYNNKDGTGKFSDFNGKLIILDFWSTVCSSCIEDFPRMEMLQKEFNDKIRIILVNTTESRQQIDERLMNFYGKPAKFLLPTEIPSLVNAKHLKSYFPTKGETGFHVWIDGNGRIILRGNGEINTYPEKIREYLAGKKVSYVSDAGVKAYDRQKSLFTYLDKERGPKLQYNSLFTLFSDQHAAYFGGGVLNIVDSSSQTVRNTFLNTSILDLFKAAIKSKMGNNKILFGERIDLLVEDTAEITFEKRWYTGLITDKLYSKYRFCYEQITPASLSWKMREQFMFEDLNRYLSQYGIQAKLEKQYKSCYILRKGSKKVNVKKNKLKNHQKIKLNGMEMVVLNGTIKQIFFDLFPQWKRNSVFSLSDILIDESNFLGTTTCILPSTFDGNTPSVGDLKMALQECGFDIFREIRLIDILVISKN